MISTFLRSAHPASSFRDLFGGPADARPAASRGPAACQQRYTRPGSLSAADRPAVHLHDAASDRQPDPAAPLTPLSAACPR